MKRSILLLPVLGLALGACGGSKRSVTVSLTASSLELLDPYRVGANLARVRVSIRAVGVDTSDEVASDLELGTKAVTFEGILTPATIEVRAEGYDELGNVVAYGEKKRIEDEGDITVTFPLRRNLAYLTHFPDPVAMEPQRQIYLLDVVTRAYVGKVPVPGAGNARRVTARGGKSLLVTYDENGAGKLGILDANDHTWRTVDLMQVQDLALAVEASPIGVVVGGDVVSFVNVESGQFLETFRQNVGGRVLDGAMSFDGAYAVIIVDTEPGAVLVDVAKKNVTALNVINQPGGVGVGVGAVAYVTSLSENAVVAVELSSGNITKYTGMNGLAGAAAFADRLQSVFALRTNSAGIADILSMFLQNTANKPVLVSGSIGKTLVDPVGIFLDGSGQRILIPAPGDDVTPPGLSLVAARPGAPPVSSSILYPSDPDDVYMEGAVVLRRRYRPRSAAIIYGR